MNEHLNGWMDGGMLKDRQTDGQSDGEMAVGKY